jgi:hypothetical protein
MSKVDQCWRANDGRKTTDDGRKMVDDGRKTVDDGRERTDKGTYEKYPGRGTLLVKLHCSY